MVMIDYDFNGDYFDMDDKWFAADLGKNSYDNLHRYLWKWEKRGEEFTGLWAERVKMAEIFTIKASDLVLKVSENIDPAKFDISKYEDF